MAEITARLVRHGLHAQYGDMSEAAKAAARVFVLDTLGVGIAGATAPLTRSIVKASASYQASGAGVAHSWGQNSTSYVPAYAAFVNGFQIHCQEYDCVHEPAVVHPLATIQAALMAEVESSSRAVSGKDFAIAIAVAVDMAAGIGVSVDSPIKFFRPANAGLFGAVLGISRLRGFDEVRATDALGYALAFCSGTMQAHVEGKPALPVQIANAARSAIVACDLAEAGLEGPADSLEGPFGYFSLFEDESDPAAMLDGLGKVWRIAEVSHKPFPTGRACQGGIVLMQKLRDEGVCAGDVDRIVLSAPPLIERLVGRPIHDALTANYARLCFQYCGAVALMTGKVTLGDFTEAALARADVHELGAKIEVRDDGSPNPAQFVPQTAEAKLADGRTISAEITALYGAPADPMTRQAHLDKFRKCVTFGFGGPTDRLCTKLIELTDNLETLDDVAQLPRLAAGLED